MNISINNEQVIKQLLTATQMATDNAPLMISIVGGGGKTHLASWLARFYKRQGHKVAVTTTTKMYLPDVESFDHLIDLSEKKPSLPGMDRHANRQLPMQPPSTTFIYQDKLPKTNDQQVKVKGLSAQTLQGIHDSALFSVLIVEADGAKHQPIKAPAMHEPCISESSQIVIGVTGAEAIFSKADSNNIHRWPEFSAVTSCLAGMEIGQPVLKRLIESREGMFKGAPEQAVRIWVINKVDLSKDLNALTQLAEGLLEQLPALNSIWLTQLNAPTAIKSVLLR